MKKGEKMKAKNEWITSPRTGRQYLISAMYMEKDGVRSLHHWQIECKKPNGVLYEFFKSYDEAFEYLQEGFKDWY